MNECTAETCGTCRVVSSRVVSSRVESSHITWRPLASWRKLSSRVTERATSRIMAETVESSHITSHGDRPLASRRKLSSRGESHHITWRPLASRRNLCRVTESLHMATELSHHGGTSVESHQAAAPVESSHMATDLSHQAAAPVSIPRYCKISLTDDGRPGTSNRKR
jgi:glucose-6-phosphate dehydrogenase assembly protein OpcA